MVEIEKAAAMPNRAKLTKALADIDRNHGMMWEPQSSFEAQLLWAQLHSKGYVQFNQWAGSYQLSPAGRAALEAEHGR